MHRLALLRDLSGAAMMMAIAESLARDVRAMWGSRKLQHWCSRLEDPVMHMKYYFYIFSLVVSSRSTGIVLVPCMENKYMSRYKNLSRVNIRFIV